MNYKDRLTKFNKSIKYASEVEILRGLLVSTGGRVLDYGCGTGFTVRLLRIAGHLVSGYDLHRHDPSFKYVEPQGPYDAIYFMHSLAHVDSPLETIKALKQHLHPEGIIIIITPNKEWLDVITDSPGYQPDPTVVQHFCQYKLESLIRDAGMKVAQQGQFGERIGDFNERLFITAKL